MRERKPDRQWHGAAVVAGALLLALQGWTPAFAGPREQARQRALELDRDFQQAYQQTALPEGPDIERIDAFLVSARRKMIDA